MSHRLDLEGRLQVLAATRLTPAADPAVLARALAARDAGRRVELPVTTATRRAIMPWIFVAGLAAGLTAILRLERPAPIPMEPAVAVPPATASVLPGDLALPFSSRPLYKPLAGPLGEHLKAGRWDYATVARPGEADSSRQRLAIAFERSRRDGQPVWLFLSGGWARDSTTAWQDSVWVTADSLRTLARWHQLPNGHVEEIYRNGEILIGETTNGYTAWYTRAPGRGFQIPLAGEIQWHYLLATLQTAKLTTGWTGSFGFMSPMAYEGRSWAYLNVRVTREDTQTVPAGTFDCWKLVMGVEDVGGIQLWVSKREGWLVAQEFRMPGKDLVRLELQSARTQE